MFLKHKPTGSLVEILEIKALFDPFEALVVGRFHAGEEMQDPEKFPKAELMFPSEEPLPQCWLDAEYRQVA